MQALIANEWLVPKVSLPCFRTARVKANTLHGSTKNAKAVFGSIMRVYGCLSKISANYGIAMQRGITLVEVVVALLIAGCLMGLAAPRLSAYVDGLAVRRAEEETVSFYQRARIAAVYGSNRVRITFGADSLVAVAEGETDSTIWQVPGPASLGVSLSVSRREIRIYPNGLGLGAANSKLVFRRGKASDSLTISRLGRLRM